MISFKDSQPQLEEIIPDAPLLAPLASAPAAKPVATPAPAPGPVPVALSAAPPPPPMDTSAQGVLALRGDEILERPDVVEARVYRLRSGFVRHNVYITLGWIEQGGQRRPIEIFFNSKDLTRSPEYAILTRLISALFRKSTDPAFILEELRGIHDPAGGVYKNGRYMLSFYAEVAEVIERFFYDVGILRPQVADYAGGGQVDLNQTALGPAGEAPGLGATVSLEAASAFPDQDLDFSLPAAGHPGGPTSVPVGASSSGRVQQEHNHQFKFCPECNQRTLKLENGCDSCLSCGYSKCDK